MITTALDSTQIGFPSSDVSRMRARARKAGEAACIRSPSLSI
jgi:hypothetical protein